MFCFFYFFLMKGCEAALWAKRFNFRRKDLHFHVANFTYFIIMERSFAFFSAHFKHKEDMLFSFLM